VSSGRIGPRANTGDRFAGFGKNGNTYQDTIGYTSTAATG
jgi:hypothetical protein